MNPYQLARKEIGVVEWRNGDNPKVLRYFKEAGHSWVDNDEMAWCAAFASAMIERAGYKSPKTLRAREFLDFGETVSLDQAKPGDICIFSRGNNPAFGHVAFFVKRHNGHVVVLGGNQSNSVSEVGYARDRLLGVRRGPWNKEKPPKPTFWARLFRRLK